MKNNNLFKCPSCKTLYSGRNNGVLCACRFREISVEVGDSNSLLKVPTLERITDCERLKTKLIPNG